MLSELRRRKLNRMFDMYDANKNGFVEETDYEQIVSNVATLFGLAPGSAELERVRAQYMGLWSNVRQLSTTKDKSRVTRDEFLAGYEKILGAKEAFVSQVSNVVDTLIALADRDGDGKLSVQECADHLRGFDLSVTDAEAVEATRQLDRDGRGHLTRADIARLVEEFLYSEDPAAIGNGLLGKLG